MKFRLLEKFSKSMPDWLKQKLEHPDWFTAEAKNALIKHNFDFRNAKFKELELPEDTVERNNYVLSLIKHVILDLNYKEILFILFNNENKFNKDFILCPKFNTEMFGSYDDIEVYEHLTQNSGHQVIAACYAYDWRRDFDLIDSRKKSETEHKKLVYNSQERSSYSGLPLIIMDRPSDKSGYIQKPSEYYLDKLLKYQRQDYQQALMKAYNKINSCSAIVKNYIRDEDLLDTDISYIKKLLDSVKEAATIYNRVLKLIAACKSEDEIDELFSPYSDFFWLNDKVKKLENQIKNIKYVDFNW